MEERICFHQTGSDPILRGGKTLAKPEVLQPGIENTVVITNGPFVLAPGALSRSDWDWDWDTPACCL